MKRVLTFFFLGIFLSCSLVGCQSPWNATGNPPFPSAERESPGAPLPSDAKPEEEPKLTQAPERSEEAFSMKGVWLSQFDLAEVYLLNGRQRPKEDFELRMDRILAGVKDMGFDTAVVQVHPYGDSFYPSAFFPPSRYVTGAYGREMDYDAFAVIDRLCQKHSLRLHAWINPMRLMKESEIVLLDDSHPLRRSYEEQTGEVRVWQGRCYLDPYYESVREWIALAARELCESYAIEAVHIDDYFYPTTDESFDQASYASYREGGGVLSLGDFRRENVSQMVRELYRAVKKTDAEKLFGISPAGNADSVYNTMYADVYRWCREEGFFDYICPQLYFGFEHEKCPFEQSVRKWHELCREGKGKLVIGLSLTKASLAEDPYAGKGRYEWAQRDDIVMRSAAFAAREEYCAGICVFSYSYLRDPLSGKVPETSAREVSNLLCVLPAISFSKAKISS